MIDLSIIIVNYKTPALTEKCIESVFNTVSNAITFEIIVVDNHSEDDSEELVTSVHKNVKWINNPINEGFGRANNLGIQLAKGKFVLLLNSDILLENDAIERSINVISSIPNAGVLGCQPLNMDGSIQRFTSTIASFRKLIDQNILFNYFFPARKLKTNAVMGSFMLFPKTVLTTCGNFDPDFFMYSEEIELCHRVSKKGFQIIHETNITIKHENGGSTPDRRWANRQSYLSSALLFYKIHGFCGYILYHFIKQSNYIMNFLIIWKFNKAFRKDFKIDFINYFSVFKHYFTIPILYSRKTGKGKRILKYTMN